MIPVLFSFLVFYLQKQVRSSTRVDQIFVTYSSKAFKQLFASLPYNT